MRSRIRFLSGHVRDRAHQRETAALTMDGVLARRDATFRPAPVLRSQTEKPISFKPSSTPSVKCSSA
jgi:hypothetical protein